MQERKLREGDEKRAAISAKRTAKRSITSQARLVGQDSSESSENMEESQAGSNSAKNRPPADPPLPPPPAQPSSKASKKKQRTKAGGAGGGAQGGSGLKGSAEGCEGDQGRARLMGGADPSHVTITGFSVAQYPSLPAPDPITGFSAASGSPSSPPPFIVAGFSVAPHPSLAVLALVPDPATAPHPSSPAPDPVLQGGGSRDLRGGWGAQPDTLLSSSGGCSVEVEGHSVHSMEHNVGGVDHSGGHSTGSRHSVGSCTSSGGRLGVHGFGLGAVVDRKSVV